MSKVVVSQYQNLQDIAVQEYGTVQGTVKLCKDNNLSIDIDLEPGQILLIDDAAIIRKSLVAYFKRNSIKVNTGQPITSLKYFDITFDFSFE